jgi:dTDP-4-dehydrorhamnose reductase
MIPENLNPEKLARVIGGCDAIINAIGYTSVDQAESNSSEADFANGKLAGFLADVSRLIDARFLHISSDYVFDGLAHSPYKTTHKTNPLSAYGRSKLLGEILVADSGSDFSILRTAWLYGSNGKCFPRLIAESLKRFGTVRVVNDQVGQPTWTRDLAKVVLQVVQLEKMPRIVHAVSSGQASWADFAKEVANTIGISDKAVEEISSAEYPTPARRPEWSVLDNSSDVLIPIGNWRERWRASAPEVLRGI